MLCKNEKNTEFPRPSVLKTEVKKHCFFVINQIITSCFVLCVFAVNSLAAECNSEDFVLEFITVETFAPEESYTARLTGTIQLPNPNYSYEFIMDDPVVEGMQRATLRVFEKEEGGLVVQVTTMAELEQTIKIPHESSGLFIDVEKPYNYGGEFYQFKFPANFDVSKTVCLKPEQYKQ